MTAPVQLGPALDTLPEWVPGTPTLGWTVIRWITKPGRFTTVDGPRAGSPLVLTRRQVLTLLWWYAVAPDGMWLFREGCSRHVRGVGKSPLGALLCLVELVGPCRPVFAPDGSLVEERPGELAGQPVSMPLVQIAAVSEAQTDNTLRFVLAWGGNDTPLAREYNLDAGKTQLTCPNRTHTLPDGRTIPVRGGIAKIVSSSSATIRGSRPSFALGDELGEWVKANDGVRFYSVCSDNATKVPYARFYGLSNAWEPGSGSVAEDLWIGWETERDAPTVVDHPRLMDVREMPADVDWSDRASIRAGLRTVYDDVPWINQLQVLTKIMDPAKAISESQREYGNWRVAAEDAWTTDQIVRSNHIADAALQPGDAVTLALDPSDTDDSTVLTATRISDGLTDVVWAHEPSLAGRATPWSELDDAVDAAHQLYDVCAFFSDVNPAEHYVKTVWPERYAGGFTTAAGERREPYCVNAAPDLPIAFDNRRHRLPLLRGTEQARAELIAGEWPHTGHPVLVRHLVNAYNRPSVGYVGIRKGSNARKIDGAVSAIMSRMARQDVLASEAWSDRYAERIAWVM